MNSRIMQALLEATRASNKVGISCSWFHDSGHWNVIVLLPVGFWPSFASSLIGWSLWGASYRGDPVHLVGFAAVSQQLIG